MPPDSETGGQQCGIHGRIRVYDTWNYFFNLNTPLARYEYLRLKLSNLPEDVIEQYGLKEKATSEGYVYM